jgi:hypothetical protein
MKKLLLLCSIIMYCLSANSQSFTASPSTVASGGTITVTASGESLSSNIYNMGGSYISASVAAPNQGYLSDINGSVVSGSTSYYNTSSQAPTTFQFKPTSSAPVNVTVTYTFVVYKQDLLHGGTTSTNLSFSVTVTPPPAIFYSAAYSKPFTRTNCGAGYQGGSYTYGVSYGFRTASTQAAANQLAIDYVNANGQAAANVNGTCSIIYYSAAISGNFTKNNCDSHSDAGPAVPYTLPAGSKTSTVSQADANALALPVFNTNGQNNANATGTCIPRNKTYISFSNQAKPGSTITRLRVYNGSTLVYDFNEAQLLAGPEIDPGTYKFVITTVGPLSNTTTNTGWATLELRTSNAPYQGGYFDNTGTTYTFNNITTASQETVQLFLYFLYA